MTAALVSQPLYYGERPPCAALRLHVAAYWHFRAAADLPATLEWIPPDGCVSIFVDSHHGRAGLLGPRTEPMQVSVPAGGCYFGARLTPGAAPAVVPVPLASLRNRRVLFEQLGLEARGALLVEALPARLDEGQAADSWDRVLQQWLEHAADPDSAVLVSAFAIIQARGEARLADLAYAVGLSPRQFRRRFGEAVGLSPKEFARVRRVRSSVTTAVLDRRQNWTEIAADHAFSDQAHLVREVRRLVGLPPGELRAHLDRIAHGSIVDP